MTLRLIPVELKPKDAGKSRHFNPGNKIKKHKEYSLKKLCLRLVHFINRGSRFTYEQIDELIMALQRVILNLQKKKQEALRKRKK